MFESLQSRLTGVFDKLRGRGALSEADVDAALGEVKTALIEADVALPVVNEFIAKVRPRAIGENVIRSVTPGQQVIKIVHDVLVETLGNENEQLSIGSPPAPILMVGRQGAGKTTTSAKLALLLQTRDKKKVLMASLDTTRPAAMEQLRVLGEQANVATLPIIAGQGPLDIAKRAIASARVGGYDAVILDTAGRQHVDDQLMAEVAGVKALVNPHETLLVADSLTGQDAVNIAKSFNDRVGVSGIILTRVDGDGRGGAALSMRSVTGAPIKFLGAGEKLDALEAFHPARVALRIDNAAPPRPSPSTRVRMMPLTPTRSLNDLAMFTASWPVSESASSRVSCGFTSAFTPATSAISWSSTCWRPAVSRMTAS